MSSIKISLNVRMLQKCRMPSIVNSFCNHVATFSSQDVHLQEHGARGTDCLSWIHLQVGQQPFKMNDKNI